MAGKQKEHTSADWVGYGLRAHLQWASLFGRGDATRGVMVAAAAAAVKTTHLTTSDEWDVVDECKEESAGRRGRDLLSVYILNIANKRGAPSSH